MIISAIIVVIGWIVTGILNRSHDIAKERMKYRLKMLHSFFPIVTTLQKDGSALMSDQNLLNNLGKSRTNFHLYGKKNEITIFEEMIKAIESEDTALAKNKINELNHLAISEIRNELRLNT